MCNDSTAKVLNENEPFHFLTWFDMHTIKGRYLKNWSRGYKRQKNGDIMLDGKSTFDWQEQGAKHVARMLAHSGNHYSKANVLLDLSAPNKEMNQTRLSAVRNWRLFFSQSHG